MARPDCASETLIPCMVEVRTMRTAFWFVIAEALPATRSPGDSVLYSAALRGRSSTPIPRIAIPIASEIKLRFISRLLCAQRRWSESEHGDDAKPFPPLVQISGRWTDAGEVEL